MSDLDIYQTQGFGINRAAWLVAGQIENILVAGCTIADEPQHSIEMLLQTSMINVVRKSQAIE